MSKKSSIHLKNSSSLDANKSGNLRADLNSNYLSKHVRFTFRDCQLAGQYGVCKTLSEKAVAADLFNTLKEFEDMDWSTFMSRPRKTGWSQERRSQPNYAMLQSDFPGYTHFGHIRVKSSEHKTFRIFCGRLDDMAAILKIDVHGIINH